MSAQHTPGPWEIIKDGGSTRIHPVKEGVGRICTVTDGKYQNANARLIAAAPELLEAGKKFLAFYNDLAKSNPGFMGKLGLQDYAQYNEAMLELPAAIAKAEGNS